MLVIDQLKTFFSQNNIDLQVEKTLPLDDVGTLLLEADKMGRSFAGFVLNAIINAKRDGIQTNFSSWDELYECYIKFMIGYNGGGVN
jgi:hypothetical protein